jgi:hypothetical protein
MYLTSRDIKNGFQLNKCCNINNVTKLDVFKTIKVILYKRPAGLVLSF